MFAVLGRESASRQLHTDSQLARDPPGENKHEERSYELAGTRRLDGTEGSE